MDAKALAVIVREVVLSQVKMATDALRIEFETALRMLPVAKDGQDGARGADGTSVHIDDVRKIVALAFDAMPKPVDGVPGLHGKDGADGLHGKDGQPGIAGKDGAPGPEGQRGMDGPAGMKGDKGDAGAPGADGKDGMDGNHGSNGADGKDGAPGPKGDPGMKGDTGEPGEVGAMGPAGEKGMDGAPGADGEDGVDGQDGEDGADGIAGAAGQKGADGIAGRDGQPGVPGREGAKGADGLDGFTDMDLDVDESGRVLGIELRAPNRDPLRKSAKLPMLIDQGVWKQGHFERGDGVTFSGSFWIAQKDTDAKPSESSDWRLAVKRGQDRS